MQIRGMIPARLFLWYQQAPMYLSMEKAPDEWETLTARTPARFILRIPA
jgi:hypothetical protein